MEEITVERISSIAKDSDNIEKIDNEFYTKEEIDKNFYTKEEIDALIKSIKEEE